VPFSSSVRGSQLVRPESAHVPHPRRHGVPQHGPPAAFPVVLVEQFGDVTLAVSWRTWTYLTARMRRPLARLDPGPDNRARAPRGHGFTGTDAGAASAGLRTPSEAGRAGHKRQEPNEALSFIAR
jgi:hypothetical protein